MNKNKILEMIMQADGTNQDALKKIDEAVCEFFGVYPKPLTRFTRSMDSIMDRIRDNLMLHFSLQSSQLNENRVQWIDSDFNTVTSPPLATPELALLYYLVSEI